MSDGHGPHLTSRYPEGMALQDAKLVTSITYPFWPGNLGKSWITNTLAAECDPGDGTVPLRVLDIGAGSGSGWTSVVHSVPQIHLTLWDADPQWYQHAARNGRHSRLNFVNTLDGLDNESFEVVTSMSVLEHVADLEEHFSNIKSLLRPSGIGIVLWDDGHFRPSIDLTRPIASSSLAFKESTKWAASVALGRRVPPSHFQRRRPMDEVVLAATRSGLDVAWSTFVGLDGVKSAVSHVPAAHIVEVMNAWLTLERQLISSLGEAMEQRSMLEQLFASRIVIVRKSELG